VLETHAVSRAALNQDRDLRAAYAALGAAASCTREPRDISAALDQPSRRGEPRSAAHWIACELHFHRALNDQGGNSVLSSLAERTLRDGLSACPIVSPEVLTLLQSHHRQILRCVEANAADAAAHHTRAHLRYLRDVLVDAERGAVPTSRAGLHT
jgi:DNA-binding FadR family transcriptional regulator